MEEEKHKKRAIEIIKKLELEAEKSADSDSQMELDVKKLEEKPSKRTLEEFEKNRKATADALRKELIRRKS